MKFKLENIDAHRIADVVASGCKLLLRSLGLFIRLFLDSATDVIFGLVNKNKSESLPPITDLILLESAKSLAAKIRTRKLKSVQVVESFIARINEVNPILNAVIDDNFLRALEDAKKVDELIASGLKSEKELEDETPFLGVPFTTKDSIAVEGLHQTIGLRRRKDEIADKDAEVVRLMRKAGAIILAHTNVSEVCMWWESSNNVYGTTNNPYDTTRIAGGSSGGEGSIIAAAGSVMGIGSDVGGSIRIPSFFNGIFGHKPSTGLGGSEGQLPIPMGEIRKYVVSGPMCRYASDMLPIFKVLAHEHLDKLNLDEAVNISSLRYFYMSNDGGSALVSKVHPSIKKALGKVISYFQTAHGIKSQKVEFEQMKHSVDIWSHKMTGAGAPKFCEELVERKGKLNCFWELLKWFCWCSDHTLPAISLGIVEKFSGPETRMYDSFMNMYTDLSKEFDDLLGSNGVFLYPTHPRPAPYHNQPLLMPFNFSYTAIFNVLGLPSTNCPLGLNENGLPIGIQVVANKYNDRLCLAVACELERAFGGWVSPSLIY
uniref:Amidase domain-containing protein n=1 Tax=Strigamia maritima TaxID=126957 RepID=T1JFB4_STRMM